MWKISIYHLKKYCLGHVGSIERQNFTLASSNPDSNVSKSSLHSHNFFPIMQKYSYSMGFWHLHLYELTWKKPFDKVTSTYAMMLNNMEIMHDKEKHVLWLNFPINSTRLVHVLPSMFIQQGLSSSNPGALVFLLGSTFS